MNRAAILVILMSSLWLIPPLRALEVFGFEFTGVEAEAGLAYILNAVGDSAPAPLVNMVGLSLILSFPDGPTFRPEFTFYTHNYGYRHGRAIPLEPIFDSVVLLGVGIFPWFGLEYELGTNLSVGWEATLGFVPRFPVFFVGTGGDQALHITGWFIVGRFLYPAGAGYFTWKFSELFRFTLRLQALLPIFNLWTETKLWDQTQFNLLVGIRWDI